MVKIHEETAQAEPAKEEPSSGPVLRLRDLVGGTVIIKSDASDVVGCNLGEYDVSLQDREHIVNRATELAARFKAMAKTLSGDAIQKIDKIRSGHAAHITRLEKKRKLARIPAPPVAAPTAAVALQEEVMRLPYH